MIKNKENIDKHLKKEEIEDHSNNIKNYQIDNDLYCYKNDKYCKLLYKHIIHFIHENNVIA